MKVVIIATGIIGTILYILFSDPKTEEQRKQHRYSDLFKSCLRGAGYTPEDVFKTLNDAGIGPAFLENELNN